MLFKAEVIHTTSNRYVKLIEANDLNEAYELANEDDWSTYNEDPSSAHEDTFLDIVTEYEAGEEEE